MDTINVLIVEDMAITAMEIERSLIKMGYGVTDRADSYDAALKSIRRKRPDIILLDIDLKGKKDGIELAQRIQRTDTIPFIYLTAADNDRDTVQRAFGTDYSTYLSKPFRREELQANILSALKKRVPYSTLKDIGNGYSYDETNKNIYDNSKPILLGSNEKTLLNILLEAKGMSVPFAVIKDQIWGSTPTAENSLRSLIFRLRTKLDRMEIKTIPGFGYRIKGTTKHS